jgi:hypothetical protein
MNLDIVEKVKRMITTSTELKGLGMKPDELAAMRENVAHQMYEDINDAIELGAEVMVLFLSSFSSSSELGTPSSLRQNG